jgi:hypothetical protein
VVFLKNFYSNETDGLVVEVPLDSKHQITLFFKCSVDLTFNLRLNLNFTFKRLTKSIARMFQFLLINRRILHSKREPIS